VLYVKVVNKSIHQSKTSSEVTLTRGSNNYELVKGSLVSQFVDWFVFYLFCIPDARDETPGIKIMRNPRFPLRWVFTLRSICSRDWVTIDGVWIGNRIYWTLAERNYKYLRQSHWVTPKITVTTAHISVFTSRCLVAAFKGGRSPLPPASATSFSLLTAAATRNWLSPGTDRTENVSSIILCFVVAGETCS
jgi:hypothetical protein